MTQEDKELLLKDLCARLPYGVKFAGNKNIYTAKGLDLIVTDEGEWEYAVTAKGIAPIEIDFIKPYLFPLLSLPKKATREFNKTLVWVRTTRGYSESEMTWDTFDCVNKYHIDYRNLIEKGLAIDATGLNIY